MEQMRPAAAIRTAEARHRNGRIWHRTYILRPFVLAALPAYIPDRNQLCAPAQVIDMPVRASGNTLVMTDPGAQATGAEGGADVDIPAGPQLEESQAADADAAAGGASEQ